MKSFNFKFVDGHIHILEYPEADTVLELPDDNLVKQLKDMLLHWWDLCEAKNCLQSMDNNYSDVINRALAQNAIVLFYKCFSSSKFRNYRLIREKILANYPPEAKKVFDYYKDLRDKFIAHDESRLAQVFTGIILNSKSELPVVDVVSSVVIAEKFKGEEEIAGLQSFYNLITVSLQWVETKIDELTDLTIKKYKDKPLSDFHEFPPLQMTVPDENNMFEKRY